MNFFSKLPIKVISLSFFTFFAIYALVGMFFANEYPKSFCQWDCGWYFDIFVKGYVYDPTKQSNISFFPLYPLLIKAFSVFFPYPDQFRHFPMLLVNYFLTFFNMVLIVKLIAKWYRPQSMNVYWASLIVFCFLPTSFYYFLGYSEAISHFTLLMFFYFYSDKKMIKASLALSLFVLSRKPGSFFVLFHFFYYFVGEIYKKNYRQAFTLGLQRIYIYPFLTIVIFCSFQWLYLGDPFAFVHTVSHWNMNFHFNPLIPLLSFKTWEDNHWLVRELDVISAYGSLLFPIIILFSKELGREIKILALYLMATFISLLITQHDLHSFNRYFFTHLLWPFLAAKQFHYIEEKQWRKMAFIFLLIAAAITQIVFLARHLNKLWVS